MPNYRGLGVLRFECERLEATIEGIELDIADHIESEDLWLDRSALCDYIDTKRKVACHYGEKLDVYRKKLDELNRDNDTGSNDIDYEPLEFLFQEAFPKMLRVIERQVKHRYGAIYNSLLSSETLYFSRPARKVARCMVYYFSVSGIVSELLMKDQINELNELYKIRKIPDAALHIADKYRYFEERLEHNLEVYKLVERIIDE